MGLIVRTVAEGRRREQLEADIKYLTRLWKRIRRETGKSRAPRRIHQELDLTAGLIRDVFRDDVDSLVIDAKEPYQEIRSYLKTISPEMLERVKLYQDDVPLFDSYQVEREIEKTLHRRVNLRRGGFITIDPTEALVAIDVNTGRYRGGRDQEETIVRTNMEAAREVARQVRLRDMGGIIVIDFIDMESDESRRRLTDELRSCFRNDRARWKILSVSELGLVEMTRQRVRPSIFHYMSEPCPYCEGIGRVFSFQSMKMKVERWVKRIAAYSGSQSVILRLHPDHVQHLSEDPQREFMRKLQADSRVRVELEGDSRLNREELRIVSPETREDITEEFGV